MTKEDVTPELRKDIENCPIKTWHIFTEYRNGVLYQGIGLEAYIEKCNEYYKQVAEKHKKKLTPEEQEAICHE